jgi:hypothetical protein
MITTAHGIAIINCGNKAVKKKGLFVSPMVFFYIDVSMSQF